jgi:hypothetical protein
MYFVEYVLGELNELNTMFQAQKPLFHLLKSQVQKLLCTLGMNFVKPSYIRVTNPFAINPYDEANYPPDNSVYIGYKGHDLLMGLETKEVVDGCFVA